MKHAAFVSVVLCGLLSCCGAEPTAAELVRRAKNRPSLLCTAARLPEVRARLAADADAKKWLDRPRQEEKRASVHPARQSRRRELQRQAGQGGRAGSFTLRCCVEKGTIK